MMATAIGEKKPREIVYGEISSAYAADFVDRGIVFNEYVKSEIEQQYNRQAYCEKCRKYRKRREVGKSEKQNRLNGG